MCNHTSKVAAIRSTDDHSVGTGRTAVIGSVLLNRELVVWTRHTIKAEALVIVVFLRVFAAAGFLALGNVSTRGTHRSVDFAGGVVVVAAGGATLTLDERGGRGKANEGEGENGLLMCQGRILSVACTESYLGEHGC